MSTAPDGTSTITAGLDYWFSPPRDQEPGKYDIGEYVFNEWRLQQKLGVDHFLLPPDYRTSHGGFANTGQETKNLELTVPMLRFPRWHRCPNVSCQALYEAGLSEKSTPRCKLCKPEGKAQGRVMLQVQFVAVCEGGHIQDFPWREWVHRSANPVCTGQLRMHTTGGGTLKALRVRCECGKNRDLEGILSGTIGSPGGGSAEEAKAPSTVLSSQLDPDGPDYLCKGQRPWLSDTQGEGCGRPLKGTLRGATNVYFATVESSLYLPLADEAPAKSLLEFIEREGIAGDIKDFVEIVPDYTISQVRSLLERKLPDIPEATLSDESVAQALGYLSGATQWSEVPQQDNDPSSLGLRRPEFDVLRDDFSSPDLLVRSADIEDYDHDFSRVVSRVQLVPKLRETRVFAGFSRISPVNPDAQKRTSQLWRTPPSKHDDWLPAYKVFGEGIYLELDEAKVAAWEQRPEVMARTEGLANRELRSRWDSADGAGEVRIIPRFVLVHTLAHLLINQLVFECGYSSASLRERLYVSDDPVSPMAGLLIYTASGDSEGTMGGLVRMGKAGLLESVLYRAISRAQWCSSDPVCMEMGKTGQGPDSCNLAACHACALLPETSCEEFNKFLDRWTVVGEPTNLGGGFFSDLITKA